MLSADIKGLVELQAKYAQVITDLHGEPMLGGMRKAALLVATDAKKLAPVDTGRLRSSLTPEIRAQGQDVIGVVGSNVLYAPYMETGTKPHFPPPAALEVWARRHHTNAYAVARAIARRGTKPRRYLQTAFEQNQDAIQRLIGGAVTGIIER